ncbi:hypothetical protein IPZ58_11840 [Streptomyces roseoverticillatus]|uniref:hypothetical protein n=1 Tax=Streptomyces roseoverticillatus TaxID=66429 RepID=UPI001F3BE165|nr:hypothetical protein [Streptomyces roseoverticillatus]MCF3102275.1 hypothetical protein [Streptomyces roseoverticillatus]
MSEFTDVARAMSETPDVVEPRGALAVVLELGGELDLGDIATGVPMTMEAAPEDASVEELMAARREALQTV